LIALIRRNGPLGGRIPVAEGIDAMTHFAAHVDADTEGAVVRLTGDCDLAAKDHMSSVLTAAVSQWPTVVVDLSQVDFLDSSGINALLDGYRAARQYHREFFVTNANNTVAAVLEITGVGKLLAPPGDRTT
jgi:anti-sigma B factor antagonist